MPDSVPWFAGIYAHYLKGILPYKGGMDNQPVYIAEAISEFSRVDGETQQEEIKAAQRGWKNKKY